MPEAEIDTLNKFLIAVGGYEDAAIVFLKPLPQQLTKADALLVAAYIVALVADEGEFTRVLRAVESA